MTPDDAIPAKASVPMSATRRGVLRGLLLALPLLAVPARRATAAVLDVRRFGARGDGRHDDTLAFQRAIDALPEGGVLDVPPGDYLIDPLRSVHLRSRMHLRLARGARLLARPNAAPRAYVLTVERVSDVRISGGAIVGERHAHLGRAGEWGHGIALRGASRVSISGMRISDCWGDGLSVGGSRVGRGRVVQSSDVEIAGVTCIGNRRQGLTIGGAHRVRVHDCEFSQTSGTPPAAGIDIEPDVSLARDVRIERCILRGNRGPGIQLWKRAAGVTIAGCTIEGNGNTGILALGVSGIVIVGNRIHGNRNAGIALRNGTSDIAISRNRLRDNGRRGGDRLGGQVRIASDVAGVRIARDNLVD